MSDKGRRYSGLWPVMITPFTTSGGIDDKGLEILVEFYVEAGASGLFANCLSSEMFFLSEKERIDLTRKVVSISKGRVPVISTGTFSSNMEVNSDFFKKINDTGADAVVINSNQLVDESADEQAFFNELEALVNKTKDIPLGIYECPVPYKRLLSPKIMKWMADSKRFVYFKDTSCDIPQIKAKLEAVKGSNPGLFNANIPTALQSLKDGAAGLSPIGANFIPELYAYLADNYNDPSKQDKIEKVSSFLSVIDPLIHSNYPYSAKLFLKEFRGIDITVNSRIDNPQIPSQEYIKLNDLFKMFKNIVEEIN